MPTLPLGMHLPEFTAVGMLGFAMRSGASRATPKDAEHSQVRSQNLRAASKRSTQQDRQGVSMRVQSPGHTPQARVKSPNTYQPQQQALATTRIQHKRATGHQAMRPRPRTRRSLTGQTAPGQGTRPQRLGIPSPVTGLQDQARSGASGQPPGGDCGGPRHEGGPRH